MFASAVKFCDVMHENGFDGRGYEVAIFKIDDDGNHVLTDFQIPTCYRICEFLESIQWTERINGVIVTSIDESGNRYMGNF